MVDADGTVHVIPREERAALMGGAPRVPGGQGGPQCSKSLVCGRKGGAPRNQLAAVQYDQNMGYKFSYPVCRCPKVSAACRRWRWIPRAIFWVFKRSPGRRGAADEIRSQSQAGAGSAGKARSTTRTRPMACRVDKDDNVWIIDNGQATVKKLSPDGKLLMTVGVKGKRGDWVEEKGQRYCGSR
jgi:hypothetical protein